MHSVEFLNLSFNHTSFNITYARSYNTTNLRGYLHVCVQLYMCLHSHIQFVLGCTKIHTGDMHVTPELYVVTAGVAIFFFFHWELTFPAFIEILLLFENLGPAGPKVFFLKVKPCILYQDLRSLFGFSFGIFQH